ncbi:hypothetical protein Glove_433g16 [Diversispora epigaea]|uniref:SAM domain-containing protein n=1 Tax=Diversispora epigaea TaxID=1348612 RepID=A0A397GW57_9GLOM|nr:hypothetical protein Glove_433g16 [Diversispora epigaea]
MKLFRLITSTPTTTPIRTMTMNNHRISQFLIPKKSSSSLFSISKFHYSSSNIKYNNYLLSLSLLKSTTTTSTTINTINTIKTINTNNTFSRRFLKIDARKRNPEDYQSNLTFCSPQERADYIQKNYIEDVNYDLLEDFPKWLDGIGLKKYARNFEGRNWRSLIDMRYEEMENLNIDDKYDRHTLRRYFNYIKSHINKEGTPINFKLLADFSAWLDSIGMARYASNFEGRQYQEIVEMMYEDLEALGIDNYDDRHILRRHFQNIRAAMADRRRISEEHDRLAPPDYDLLENTPAWLESMGLKSLTPFFQNRKWEDIIEMNHNDLEMMGIRNRNLRSMLVRNFWLVKRAVAAEKGINIPPRVKRQSYIKSLPHPSSSSRSYSY